MSQVECAGSCDEIFVAKTLTPYNSEPEVATTRRFQRLIGALEGTFAVEYQRSDSEGSGDTGPPKSKMATAATPEVEFRSTSGWCQTMQTVEDQVP